MTLGQQLREARERKGVSIEAAAEDTKVNADILRALEADDYSKIAAPVYAKGFLKMYAGYLGMDVQKVREDYAQASAATPASAPLHKAVVRLQQSPVDRIISSMATMWGLWVLVGAICIVLLLIVWIVIAATHKVGSGSASERRGAGASERRSVGASERTVPLQKPVAPVATPAPSLAVVTNTPPATPDAYIRPVQPKPAMLDASSQVEPPAARLAPLTLSLRLIEDSWVEVMLDGKTTLPYSIKKAGWTNEWHAQRSIILTVGNAGGVQARLNGQDLGSLGSHAKKVRRTFTR